MPGIELRRQYIKYGKIWKTWRSAPETRKGSSLVLCVGMGRKKGAENHSSCRIDSSVNWRP